jgi:DNA-binding response OmpR family regulator
MTSVLLVEDTAQLAHSLTRGLREEGMDVTAVETGGDALHALAAAPPHVMILDLGLPDLDGIEVLSRSRAAGFPGAILVLTARDAVRSRVDALDRGADDYVVKPFAFDELCARVRALARRVGPAPEATLRCGDITLVPDTLDVTIGESTVRLSPTKHALLACLVRRAGRAVTRPEILREVFGYEFDPGTNVIDVHVAHLRRKLAASRAVIQTVRGLGYRIAAHEDA